MSGKRSRNSRRSTHLNEGKNKIQPERTQRNTKENIAGVAMLNREVLSSVAKQMKAGNRVEIDGKTNAVKRTSSQRLKTVRFTMDEREYQAIEQNPEKPSRWGQLARKGHHVLQFRDVASGKYIAVAVDGEIKEYGAMGRSRRKE
jgi:hypothetical protein